jgi:hypothetical protein
MGESKGTDSKNERTGRTQKENDVSGSKGQDQ